MLPLIIAAAGAYLIGSSKVSKFEEGGRLEYNREEYYKLLQKYDRVGAFLDDAENEQEKEKYRKELAEIGSQLHRYERKYEVGGKMAQGGEVASTILSQLGGSGRLNAMTGAYNFYDIGNGLSFKIKNARANYIKITLNSMDLYDVEIGRIRGNTYKVVTEANNVYFDQLKGIIEKATGMYLSL